MKRFASLLVVLLGLGLSTLAMAAAELIDPPPVAVPASISEKELVKQIKKAFVGRNWSVEKDEKGSIKATLYLRSHVARVSADYTKDEVTFTYLSSENLAYKEKKGKRLIHKNYLMWIQNVRNDLNKNLQLEMLDAE
jgi:hypothetical protein